MAYFERYMTFFMTYICESYMSSLKIYICAWFMYKTRRVLRVYMT